MGIIVFANHYKREASIQRMLASPYKQIFLYICTLTISNNINMKRLTIIMMLLVTWGAGAQYVIDKGTESRHIDGDHIYDATFVGIYDGLTVWVGEARGGWQVTYADHDMEPVFRQGLKTKANELLVATHSADTVTLMLADRSQSRRTDVLLARCVPNAAWTIDTLLTMTYGKKDLCLLWGAVSPSGNRIGLCSIVEYIEQMQYSACIMMLHANGTLDYRHEYALGTMDNFCITDDGRAVTLGTEQDGETMHVIVNYANRHHVETTETLIDCKTLRELNIATVTEHHLIALGTMSGSGFRDAEAYYGGTMAFSYDLDGARMAGFTLRPFQNEDINILYNKPTKKIQRDLLCEHVGTIGRVALPYGAAIVMGRNFEKISQADNGIEEHSFARVGLHLEAYDTAANVVWVRNLRRNDWQEGSPNLLGVGLATIGDTLCVVKSESRKMPTAYVIGKPAKQLKMGDKNNLVLYSIAADGEVHKDILEAKSKHSLVRMTSQCDIVTRHGSRLRHIKLSKCQ